MLGTPKAVLPILGAKAETSGQIAYAEIKCRCGGATGCKEWEISRAGTPSTTERQVSWAGQRYSLLPMLYLTAEKYGETRGCEDCTGYSGGGGTGALKEIDYDQYIDNGNMQGCDAVKTYVFRDFANYNDGGNPGKYPLYPTKASVPSGYRLQRYDDNIGGWTTMTYMPFNWYDCSNWGTIGKTYLAVGAYATGGAVTPEYSDTVTILAQRGSAAVQNFAFDGMEDYE